MATILVPVDGSDHAFKALRIACDIAEKYGASISLLHVIFDGITVDTVLDLQIVKKFGDNFETALRSNVDLTTGRISEEMLISIGSKILANSQGRVEKRGLETIILPLGRGAPASCILEAISQVNANTVVMGSRGSGSDGDGSFGSVSQAVFCAAECTCISVK